MKKLLLLLTFLAIQTVKAQISYFPPLTGNTWDRASFNAFPYDSSYTDSLYEFLETKGSKAFLVLYDGRIVKEKYFGSFGADSFWYWASAGKTLAGFLVGQAQDQGLLDIGNKVSDYLDTGWTSCTRQQEDKIKIWHLLTMSSGLNGDVFDPDCTDPNCLYYKGDAGTLWYYHNAPYLLTHKVVENASGKTFQNFTTQYLSVKTGIYGLWAGDVFVSKPRVAARFGLLMLNGGVWDGDTLLKKRSYFDSMTTSSQSMNPAYGLLAWLNGKDTLMVPQSTLRLARKLNPEAPDDMYAAMGKNDQKIYVIPSQKLVIVRMGDDPGDGLLGPSSFDEVLWSHINRWRQLPTGMALLEENEKLIYPNPADGWIQLPEGTNEAKLYDLSGRLVPAELVDGRLITETVAEGGYFLRLMDGLGIRVVKVVVEHGL
ncbi:MAG: serine hydrolase [Bacteroidia bacterium]